MADREKHAWRDEDHPGCIVLRITSRGQKEQVLTEQLARNIYEDLRALFTEDGELVDEWGTPLDQEGCLE